MSSSDRIKLIVALLAIVTALIGLVGIFIESGPQFLSFLGIQPATDLQTPTITFTPSVTLTPTETFTPTMTETPSQTYTPTNHPTLTFTPSATWTPTATDTPSLTPTPTDPPTSTPTLTPSFTPSPTPTFAPGAHQTFNGVDYVYVVDVSGTFWISAAPITHGQLVTFLNGRTNRANRSSEGESLVDEDDATSRITSQGSRWTVASGSENTPAVNVSWYGGRDFCSSIGAHLPSLDEENAALNSGMIRLERAEWIVGRTGINAFVMEANGEQTILLASFSRPDLGFRCVR